MASQPNVIVILADSFRPDHIGAYGNDWIQTPNLDRFARESAVFTSAFAEYPMTIPARTALVTGCYTFTNRPWIPLKDTDVSIAQIAQANGYHTVAFSDSPFNPWVNMNKGFAEFNWIPGGKVMDAINPDREPWPDDIEWVEESNDQDRDIYLHTARNRAEFMANHGEYFPEYLAHRVTDWFDTDRDKPFFMWVDFFDPHEPWDPPSPYKEMYNPGYTGPRMPMPPGPGDDYLTPERRKQLLAQYAGCCTQTDQGIGQILDKLRAKGLLENSVVVFLSDHGEPFGEHHVVRKFGVVLYEELARIPLIMHAPGCVTGNIDGLAQNVDLAPTLCSLLGWEPGEMDGEDLSPLLRGEKNSVRERAWMGAFGMRSGVRTDRYKYIDNRGEKENELFDLEHDPGETTNIIQDQPDLARALAYELWEFTGSWGIPFAWRDGPRNPHAMSMKKS